jgi:DNA-binding SARP family transcriptional activator
VLTLRLLGEFEVLRDGERVNLPPSKKTRALLAYLAVVGRPQRRERLCTQFWEIPDDPRAALRWSLSRLRALVDEPDRARIVATRDTVAFEPHDAEIDVVTLRRRITNEFLSLSVADLEALAGSFRGEFLEGMDLTNLHDFQSWLLAEREDVRRIQVRVLATLVGRLTDKLAALPYARELVQIDPFNESARAGLLQLLLTLGRQSEAEQHFEAAMRLFKELGSGAELGLTRKWREMLNRPRQIVPEVELVPPPPPLPVCEPAAADVRATPLVGREAEWAELLTVLDESIAQKRVGVLLLTGEPGLGKSRLLADLVRTAQQRGLRTFTGHAYETERSHPYGPWMEALGADAALLAQSEDVERGDSAALLARERLFTAITQGIFGGDAPPAPALIVLDDVQWCDEASADLLHYVVRMSRRAPVVLALAGRDGELTDNPAILGALRSLRHRKLLHEIELKPLSRHDTERLVRSVAPGIDPAPLVAQSAGNPLFALELARDCAARPDELPRSLKELTRDRLDRLPAGAADLLRWASVIGRSFPVNWLMALMGLDLDALTERLEVLERHALLRAVESETVSYAFAHDLIHRAIYTAISEPRRRLMHLKVARVLQEIGDDALASEICHHAARAGEAGMAASACVRAGRRCLQLFANVEAEAMARRGQRYAEELSGAEQIERMLELTQIEILARRPQDLGEASTRIEALAERALDYGRVDHARLGFYLLSHLRWEGGLWSHAQRDTLRAEFLSRSGDDRQRTIAMAEAARCLAMIERDLGQAEALLLEAGATARRLGIECDAIVHAQGLLRAHQGAFDEAADLFTRARALARRGLDRTNEFFALEHLVTLQLQQRRFAEAEASCVELIELGEKLREGSEAPFARTLHALCRLWRKDVAAEDDLDAALDTLRIADAKHRLAVALTCAADLDLESGRLDRAQARAEEALHIATILERHSDETLAQATLARVAAARRDGEKHRLALHALRSAIHLPISYHARASAEALLTRERNAPVRLEPRSHRRVSVC